MALISPIRSPPPPPPDDGAGLGAGVAAPPSSWINVKTPSQYLVN